MSGDVMHHCVTSLWLIDSYNWSFCSFLFTQSLQALVQHRSYFLFESKHWCFLLLFLAFTNFWPKHHRLSTDCIKTAQSTTLTLLSNQSYHLHLLREYRTVTQIFSFSMLELYLVGMVHCGSSQLLGAAWSHMTSGHLEQTHCNPKSERFRITSMLNAAIFAIN